MSWRKWTDEELDYLNTKWGEISITAIARNLGRTVNAVKMQAGKEGLVRHIHSGSYITVSQLAKAVGEDFKNVTNSWIGSFAMPYQLKKSIKKAFRVIYVKDFWKWAEEHKELLNTQRFAPNTLGPEPEWLKEKRKADFYNNKFTSSITTIPWSKEDDEKLVYMLKQFKYTYCDISQALRRTEGAVKRRISTLKLKERPIKEAAAKWTEDEINLIIKLRNQGYSYEVMAEKFLNRTALSIRAKFERLEQGKESDNRTIWTDKELVTLIVMAEQGVEPEIIGKAVGTRSLTAVKKKIKRYFERKQSIIESLGKGSMVIEASAK